MIAASVQWLFTSTDQPSPVGKRSKAKIKKLSEAGADRGRGQAKPLTYDHAVSMLTMGNPLDEAIVALAFMAGLRRSEIAALTWNDIEESDFENLLIHVRTSRTNRAGEDTDIRLLKNGFAKAVRDLRSGASEHDFVIGLKPQRISQRITALAKQAGITHKLTAHFGRVGLASELTARGASTTETMLAGNWKTARMVAHYSAGAKAQRGAVAKFL